MRSMLLVLVASVMIACSSSETAAQRVPGDLVIRFAEGGGFTGQWTGAVITGDGVVRSWSPRTSDSMNQALGTIPASTMAQLWSSIERDDLLNGVSGGEPGNMTRTIVVSAGGRTVDVRWSYGTAPDARTQPYAALYEQCRASVSALKR